MVTFPVNVALLPITELRAWMLLREFCVVVWEGERPTTVLVLCCAVAVDVDGSSSALGTNSIAHVVSGVRWKF